MVGCGRARPADADAIHGRPGDEDPPALVLAGPVREQELGRGVVVHLDAESREEIAGLVEDPGDEGVVEEAQGGLHGLSSGGARRGA